MRFTIWSTIRSTIKSDKIGINPLIKETKVTADRASNIRYARVVSALLHKSIKMENGPVGI